MPPKPAPKKTTTAAKPAAKGTGTKTTASKTTAASKGATGGTSKTPAKTEEKKEEKPAVIKKVVNPVDIPLKQIATLIAYSGDHGPAYKDSGRWLFVIDRSGNAGTFLKYRDVNFVQFNGPVETSPETCRMALLGSLRFGKPTVIDISDTDQSKIMDIVSSRHDEIKAGTWKSILDRSICEEDKINGLVRKTDASEYTESVYNYRPQDYQLIILTNTDPPSCAMEDFYPVNIV